MKSKARGDRPDDSQGGLALATYSAIAPEGAARGPAAALVRREAERWGAFIRGAGIEREG